jgi:hypothetical protein
MGDKHRVIKVPLELPKMFPKPQMMEDWERKVINFCSQGQHRGLKIHVVRPAGPGNRAECKRRV